MLDVARGKCPNTRFVQADITRDPVDAGQFDLITSFRFFGNAQDELRVAALDAIAALLRPGGLLIVNNHRNPLSVAEILYRITGGTRALDLTYFKLKRMLEARRLKIATARAIGFWMFRSSLLAKPRVGGGPKSLEHAFQWPIFVPFAPDAVIVATKSA
jgi:SAM-dependent methyltransferase